jgi:hypothetical protein
MATSYTDLYVNSSAANDTGDGSIGSPKQKLNSAVSLLDANTSACTIHCYGSAADTQAVTIANTRMASGVLLTIQTDEGANRPVGVWDTGKYRLEVSAANALYSNVTHLTVTGIQIKSTLSSSSTKNGITANPDASSTAVYTISKCIIRAEVSGTSDTLRAISCTYKASGTMTMYAWNNVIYDYINAGYSAIYGFWCDNSWTAYVYNNTFHNCGVGINRNNGTLTVKNNIVDGSGDTLAYVGTMTADYNATDGADEGGGGDHDVTFATFVFNNGDNGDFSLIAGTDQTVYEGGLADPSSGLFSDDIAGTTRTSPWSIGAFEYDGPAAQFARPASTVAAGNWDGFISGVDQNDSSNLDNYIDEETASDTDSIRSAASPSDDTCTVTLSSISTPDVGTVTMRVRCRTL